jgi:predicted nucleic acid-binding protein
MKGVLIDSNILLDIFTEDKLWMNWSESRLDYCRRDHTLFINPIVYAEISIRFADVEELEDVLEIGGFMMREIPKEALFLAGKAFLAYRKQGGSRRSPLPDFFIGAHAAVEKLPLLTRDATRYQTDFPTVDLISPE